MKSKIYEFITFKLYGVIEHYKLQMETWLRNGKFLMKRTSSWFTVLDQVEYVSTWSDTGLDIICGEASSPNSSL